jgi:arginine:pyruvate transaminase
MQLSNRITTLNGGGSDGWDVFYRARRMVNEGQPIIELTIGEHDVRTDPSILDAMAKSAQGGHTGYAAVPGTAALRSAVAQRVQSRTGVETKPENVMITPGGQAALFAAHVATCNPGEHALFLDPYYATYPGLIRSAGAVPVPVQTHADNMFQPRAVDIDEAAKQAVSLLVNSPNNPTGAVYSRESLTEIADVCKKHDLWLISDEVYDNQIWEGEHISPRALEGMQERTLVIGSMSKSHAMTGSRIGWIVAPEKVIECLIDLATNTTYGVAGFIQDAAEFALAQGLPLEDKVAAPFRRRRDLAADIFENAATVKLVPAQGAMYLMLDIRATGLSGEEFANRLLDERKIAVMPGESFGQAAAGHLRGAMTVDDDRFVSALKVLSDFADSLRAT